MHTLSPGRTCGIHGVVLVHDHHTAGVSFPDIAGEAQHLAARLELAKGIERFGHAVAVDLPGGKRGRHVRWIQHQQIHFVGGQLRVLRTDHGRQSGTAHDLLRDDVVDRIPVGHRELLAAELLGRVDATLLADDDPGAVGVVPGRDLHRELVVVAHVDRNRNQHVREVETLGREGFDQRRPAADERRRFRVDTLLLEESHFVRDQQRRRIGDRDIADLEYRIKRLGELLLLGEGRRSRADSDRMPPKAPKAASPAILRRSRRLTPEPRTELNRGS